jgi:hypothetical protein
MSSPTPLTTAREHPLAAWLHARVLALRASTQRRNFPAAIEVVAPGTPAGGGPMTSWIYGAEQHDHALRVEVLLRLLTDCRLRGVARASLVHVRPGPHEPGDPDLGWAAAAGAASGISGVAVDAVLLVSRWGWLDLASGVGRSWVRPRARRR